MRAINLFQGMKSDLPPELNDGKTYTYGKNFRLTVDEEGKNIQLDTGKGVKPVLYINSNDGKIVHITGINDYVLIFIAPEDPNGYSHIRRLYPEQSGGIDALSSPNFLFAATSSLLYSKGDIFGDSVTSVITIENEETWNLYFVSNTIETPIRRVNILSPTTYSLDDNSDTKINLFNNKVVKTPSIYGIVSGNLKCGLYRYVYQVFEKHGSESSYSVPSEPVLLTDSNLSSASKNFFGNDSETSSGKGVEVKVDVDEEIYGRIVRIHFKDSINLPECTIVYEGKITSGGFIFTDTGSSVIGIESIDGIAIPTPNVTAKYIESKNGLLFLGNTKEYVFDVDIDTRAYRFNSLGEIQLTNGSGYTTLDSIPENHSQYEGYTNVYNDLNLDGTSNEFKYQSDGVTLGGEGNIISYEFITYPIRFTDILPEDSGFTAGSYIFFDLYNGMDTNNSPVYSPETRKVAPIGYQRDEIYRFGIVFYDYYGNKSPVKWIDDVRFPNPIDMPIISDSNKFYANVLGIKFTVDNSKLPSDVYAYQIVRAIRDRENSTVYDCGILSGIFLRNGILYTGNFNAENNTELAADNALSLSNSGSNKYYDYISPEAAFYKEWRDGADRIDFYKSYKTAKSVAVNGSTPTQESIWSSPVGVTVRPKESNLSGSKSIDSSYFYEYRKSSNDYVDIPLDGLKTCIYSEEPIYDTDYRRGYRYSSFILKLDSNISNHSDFSGYHHPAYAYRRKLVYPYGGYSQVAIENTKYISCSKVVFKSIENTVDIYNGDVYIGIFNYMWAMHDGEIKAKVRQPVAVQALVESRINLWLDSGETVPSYDDNVVADYGGLDNIEVFESYPDEYSHWAIHEETGSYQINDDATKFFVQAKNLFVYNSAYSAFDPKIYYYPKSNLQSDVTEFPTRLLKSPRKLNNSLSDSWSRLSLSNYLDLDSKFGDVTGLLASTTSLLVFQNRGIAFIPVDERSVVSDSNNNQLTIGKSDTLSRYDYITTDYGISNITDVAKNNKGIYFIDPYRKAFGRITNTLEILSILGGIHTLVSKENFSNTYVLCNDKIREVFFVVDGKSYLFFEDTNTFVSVMDLWGTKGFSTKNYFYAIAGESDKKSIVMRLDDGANRVYNVSQLLLDTGYSTPSEFELEFPVVPNNGMLNRLDALLINGVVYGTAGDIVTTLTLSNNYQSRSDIPANEAGLVRKFRTHRLHILRDSNNDRFVDYYNVVTLKNNNDVGIIIKSIFADYMPIFNR